MTDIQTVWRTDGQTDRQTDRHEDERCPKQNKKFKALRNNFLNFKTTIYFKGIF